MRSLAVVIFSLVFALAGLSQSTRGTITGAIADTTGAVVANAAVEAKNQETGAVYAASTTGTGNYTLAELPTGTYEVSVAVPGFKKYIRQGITVLTAQTLRIDVALEVGANTESITVTSEASLLKTESGELSHNVTTERLDNLPVLGIGSLAAGAFGGTGTGLRNPYSVLQVLPGSDFRPDSSIRLNGMPSNTGQLRIEGQESGSGIMWVQSWTQPSVDAIQEFAIDTSNYAAEFGQAGGGVFNTTMKSGTNQYHGSGYDYFVNEALNAGVPFTNDGKGHLLRPRQRRNDYGFTLGGAVYIPKVYNGHDKTFFFFNFEQFRETQIINNIPKTVPTALMRSGNFSQILTSRNLCPAPCAADPLGRSIMENTIYDPRSDRLVSGARTWDPFPGNIIPPALIDAVAAKVQAFMPLPAGSNAGALINNYLPTYTNPRVSSVPSVKIDHLLSAKSKLCGYYARTSVASPQADGMPFPITSAQGADVVTHTIRLNFDYTMTPTLLLHAGAGYLNTNYLEVVGAYNVEQGIGLKGTYDPNLFPRLNGLSNAQGGYGQAIGASTQIQIQNLKPTGNLSLTWVRNNHTYKAGGELIVDGYVNTNNTYAAPWILFSPIETGLPALNGVGLPGSVGFGYASFFLGRVDNGYTSVPTKTRLGRHAVSFFAQDTWKVTRKLTVDYGIRYDFQTYLKANHGLFGALGPHTPNPTAGGLPGGTIFEGYEPGHCMCEFAHNYPWAFGPRLGVAYQMIPKTVLRVGAGVSYSRTAQNDRQSYDFASSPYAASSYGDPAYLLQNGLPYKVTFPNLDPGQLPLPGTLSAPLSFFDQNGGRPARTIQWSIGLQREITSNLVVEAAYVGNRGVWWQANPMANDNMLTPQILAAHGLSLTNPDDLTLLNSPLNSPLAIARGFGTPPYQGFPLGAAVGQSLRPYPEYTTISRLWNPVGDTWYNSLQAKATKRFSHGLDLSSSFTWAKQQTVGTETEVGFSTTALFPAVNDPNNRQIDKTLSGFDQPFLFVFSGTYTTPKLAGNRVLSWIARDWQLGSVLRYASGLPILAPLAQNGLKSTIFLGYGPGSTGGTPMNRVTGVPLFTHNLNCHCFDPNTTFVLNPGAWSNPAPGQFGTAAFYYSDYRYQHRPVENVGVGRQFRIKERATLRIRAEFTNIFNRTEPNNPTANNALATQTTRGSQTTAGFGFINTGTVFSAPRQATLVARFQF